MASTSLAGPSSAAANHSIVQDYGEYSSTCGYCKSNRDTSVSHGMQAIRLTVYDYQDLIDQGWRRSGCYVYKPNLEKSCCKSYTIRLHAPSCVLSKDQKRVLSKLDRYLQGTLEDKSKAAAAAPVATSRPGSKPAAADPAVQLLQDCLTRARDAWAAATGAPAGPYPTPPVQRPSAKALKTLPSGTHFSSACAFPTAAAALKLLPSFPHRPADVASALAHHFNALGCGYQAVAIGGHLNFIPDSTTTATTASAAPHPIPSPSAPAPHITPITTASAATSTTPNSPSPTSPPKKRPVPDPSPTAGPQASGGYQRHSSHAQAGPSGETRQAGGHQPPSDTASSAPHKWEIKLVPSTFIEEEYQLYRKYQMLQHKDAPDKVSTRGYKEFLVRTPLVRVPHEQDPSSPPCGYGSFHQQYWLDDQLIAVGVIDILPRCLSSVYLFWDPAFAHLAPGKLSALKEIQWVAAACAAPSPCPQLQWYYMGFYIPTCHKMRYKGEYQPSDLLCPRARTWVRLTPEVAQVVDVGAFVALSELEGAVVSPNLALPGGSLVEATAAAAAQAQAQAQAGRDAGGSKGRPKGDRRAYSKVAQVPAVVEEVIVATGHVQVPLKVLLARLQKDVANNLAEQVERWTALVGPQLSASVRYALQ